MLADVDFYDFIFVFNVVVEIPPSVRYGELGLAGDGNGGDNFAGVGVDDADVVAPAIEDPDGFCGGLPDDGVGVGAGGNGSGDGKGGAIEYDDGVAATVGNVASFAVGVEATPCVP